MHAHAHDEEENLPVPRLADEDDILFIKSNNTSAPIVRCRDQVAVEGLGTGRWEEAEELEVQGWIEVVSPPSTAVGKGTRGRYDRQESEASDGLLSRHTESSPAAGASPKVTRPAEGVAGRCRWAPSAGV